MNTVAVPESLRPPRLSLGLDRARGFNIEEHFFRWAGLNDIRTSWTYLPIFWWNQAMRAYCAHPSLGFRRDVSIEEFVRNLQTRACFTVSRGADGIYEQVPDSLLVFSAGGEGAISIPHVCEEIGPVDAPQEKRWLASFVGNLSPGGPEVPRPIGRSSSNPDGAGTQLRQAMARVFASHPDCLILDQQIGSWPANGEPPQYRKFREIAAASWFGLAPRGYGKTSYRLYEMIALGTIPVYIYDEPWLPYLDQLDWREFAVLCHESELPSLPDRLRAIPEDKRLAMLARAQELLEPYFTPDGVCQQIAHYLELLG